MKNWPRPLVFALVFHGLVLFWWLFDGWLEPDAALFLALAVGAVSMEKSSKMSGPCWFWAISGLGFLMLGQWLPARTIHFLAWSSSLFFALSSVGFRTTAAHGLLAVAASSLVKNWALVFSFPLRLEMSNLAAKGLRLAGFSAKNAGNVIVLNEKPFVVDPSCMGLSMLQTSLVAVLFCWFFFEKRSRKSPSLGWLAVLFGAVLGLVWSFNLIRIWALVLGGWPPESVGHEAVGLIGWAFYVVGPLFFLTGWIFRNAKSSGNRSAETSKNEAQDKNLRWPFLTKNVGLLRSPQAFLSADGYRFLISPKSFLTAFLAVGLVWISLFDIHPAAPKAALPADLDHFFAEKGFEKALLPSAVFKMRRSDALIYAKPIRGFFDAEHSPLVCWQGDGWQIARAEVRKIGEREVFFGLLKNEKSELPTAWWFDNGPRRTISQAEWRKADAAGEPTFFLLNATAADEKGLVALVDSLLNRR